MQWTYRQLVLIISITYERNGVLRRQGSQVRILSGAPENEKAPLWGFCRFPPADGSNLRFDQLRQQLTTERRSREARRVKIALRRSESILSGAPFSSFEGAQVTVCWLVAGGARGRHCSIADESDDTQCAAALVILERIAFEDFLNHHRSKG